MKISGYNKILIEKRKELGISLKEASAKLKITSFALYLYEKGYVFVHKKYYQNFIETYSLPEDFFEDNYFYPEPDGDSIAKNKFIALTKKLWFRILAFLIFGGSVALLICGNNLMNYSNENVLSFYSQNVINYRNTVLKDGFKPAVESAENILVLNKTYSDEKLNADYAASSIIYEDPEETKFTLQSLTVTPKGETSNIQICTIYIQNSYSGVYLDVVQQDLYDVTFLVDNGRYSVSSVEDAKKKIYDDQTPEYYLYAGLAMSNLQTHSPYLDKAIQDVSGNPEITTKEFFKEITEGNDAYTSSFGDGVAMLLFGGIVTVFAGLTISIGVSAEVFARFANKKALEIELIDADNEVKIKKRKQLKPNIRFPFFVPETLLRAGVIVLILLASIATYAFFSYFLGLVGIGQKTSLDPDKILVLLNFYKITANFVCIATVLHMFTKIDTFIETKKYLKNALTMFLAGCVFYVGEILVVYCASSGLNNLATFAVFLADYLPGNIFWGMGVFALFAMFIFTKPKMLEGRKKSTIAWHFCAVLPLFYLVFSMIYSCLVKTKVWDRAPFYLASLLYPKGIIISLFVILFCLGVGIFRFYIVRQYGQENAETYFKGNRYVLFKNSSAAILLLLLGIVELIIAFTPAKNNTYCSALNLGKNYYILAAIPFVFFYRPHIGARNNRLDLAYGVAYGISTSLAYVLLAILILPYISYLEPILAILIK